MRLGFVGLPILVVLVGGACAQDDAANLSYGASARQNYEKGMAELRDDNFPEAIKYFQYVRNKFPFSKYAANADLRIGDTHFAEGKYLEAIDQYKLFWRAHPTHPQVQSGYVGYRIVRGYVAQMPADWFAVPPAYERDQAAARDALREARDFMDRHANSKYAPRVRKYLKRIVRRLVDHELYAARFYLDRDKPRAAAWRIEALLAAYPEAHDEGDVVLLLGKTYLQLKDATKARQTFAQLVRDKPGDPQARKAQLYLDFMKREGL